MRSLPWEPAPGVAGRRVVLWDAALALAVLAFGLLVTAAQGISAAEAVISVLLLAPLAFRRVAPVTTFAAVLVLSAVSLVVSDRVIVGDPAPLIALYSLMAYAPEGRLRFAGLGLVLLGAVPTGLRWADDGAWVAVATVAVVVVHELLAAALGELRRAALRRAADRLRAAAAAERTRIARELHDVVAHALAVVVVQADAGAYAADQDPRAARGALETIGETARSALADMRAALGALRDDEPTDTPPAPTRNGVVELLNRHGSRPRPPSDGGVTDPRRGSADDVPRAPIPGVGDVPVLVDRLAAAGLPVTLDVRGEPAALPDAAGLAVYRVVQEALTNVIKHAGPGARAAVAVAHGDGEVGVVVTDDGRGPGGGDGGGQGLRGMRERVGLAGGTLEAGPAPGGGFRVAATIPVPR